MSSAKIMIGLDFKLLGADLEAGYLNTGAGYKIYIKQFKPNENKGILISDALTDLKKLIGERYSVDDIKNAVKNCTNSIVDFDHLTLKLDTVFLLIEKQKSKDNTEINSRIEYAFRFEILFDGNPNLENMQLFKPERLTIALWDTKDADIIKQLSLLSATT